MEKDLSNYRKSYEKGELLLENVPDNPIELFRNWFIEVDTHFDIDETNAMTISTLGLDGYPKSRVVLLKKYTYEGFIFYTNYQSEKGRAIAVNPSVCLSFFWHSAERQIIIKGKAEKIPENLSDGYFESQTTRESIRGYCFGTKCNYRKQVRIRVEITTIRAKL